MAKIGHNAKAIGQFGSKIKIAKNVSRDTLELFCAKNGSKKHLIIEKWQVFENGQNWPQCNGYRLCKMALQNGSVGSKIKIAKNMPKTSLETR